jgi:hypothetical protein
VDILRDGWTRVERCVPTAVIDPLMRVACATEGVDLTDPATWSGKRLMERKPSGPLRNLTPFDAERRLTSKTGAAPPSWTNRTPAVCCNG